MKMEGHSQDYISSYMSYVQMLGTTYRLVIKGKLLSSIGTYIQHKYLRINILPWF